MDATNKWRFRFGLRTMLIGVTLIAVPIAVLGQQISWLQARRQFRARHADAAMRTCFPADRAPSLLWLLGDYGSDGWFADKLTNLEAAEAQRLFPEAEVYAVPANP